MPLPGQIDVCNANRVAEALASAVSQGGTVTADMSATTFCDCAGARAIVQATNVPPPVDLNCG